jgi:hypothetical protein
MRIHVKVVLFSMLASIVSACVPGQDDPAPGDEVLDPGRPTGHEDAVAQEGEGVTASELIKPLAASSSSIVNTSGTRAGEAFFNRSGGDAACGGPCIALFDAKCDAHQVYVVYRINNGGATRVNNGGGCNTTLRIPLPNSGFNIAYHACVDIQGAPDVCAGDKFDHN